MSKFGLALCGHESNRSKKECAACARKRYYNSSEEVKKKIKQTNGKWEKANRNKRNIIVHKWQDSITARLPQDLKLLRKAVKYLENAISETNKRKGISKSS